MQTLDNVDIGVSDFVALMNQSMEMAFPSVTIVGELANLRVSKNRWLYFDLKDDSSTVKFFGTVYQLPGPLEDGMLLRVRGQPRLHNLYGFSVNVQNMQPAGEGSIKRSAEMLQAKLQAEGLFEASRKRLLPYPPRRIGLITSKQSAAYADFMKIVQTRWCGLEIQLIDVQVQGEIAPLQITVAIEQFNAQADPPEALVLIRGGGSPEDLAAFSSEQVTRAVAASRLPTLVAIGHEIDVSLAELAADRRASTPSNAAELLVPDRIHILQSLPQYAAQMSQCVRVRLNTSRRDKNDAAHALQQAVQELLNDIRTRLTRQSQLLAALSPDAILRRGYAIVRNENRVIRSTSELKANDIVNVKLAGSAFRATVNKLEPEGK